MTEVTWFYCIVGALIALQFIMAAWVYFAVRINFKEINKLNKETYALVKKLEALTAERRELINKSLESVLGDLTKKLPATIAAQAGDLIFEMESKILKRLAELEPNFKDDPVSKEKMDDLIKNMEGLEKLVISATTKAAELALENEKDCFQESISEPTLSSLNLNA